MREWLLLMSMSRVVEMDDTGALFNLPEGSMEVMDKLKLINYALLLPRLGPVHKELLETFKAEGPPGQSLKGHTQAC